MTRVRAACAAVVAALAVACGGAPEHAATDQYPALGTLVEVSIRGIAPDAQPAAFRAVRAAFAHAELNWHAWADGDLAHHNDAQAAGRPAAAPPDLAALLAQADAMRAATGGLFEPRIGALVEAWGFHDPAAIGAGPPTNAVAAWRAGTLPVRIDLGGIAKGAAVAAALRRLADLGVEHALVNAGGDVAVIGQAGDRRWSVGIRNPRGVGVVAGVELASGEVLFTSGDYERGFERDGVRFHHLLDPRTGYPARGTASLSVLHTDPVVADAAATALFIAGDAWPELAATLGIETVMRITDDGTAHATEAMADRLLPAASGPPLKLIRVTPAAPG